MTPEMMDLYNVVQQLNTGALRTIQNVVPTNGQTIQMLDNSNDGTLFMNPAGTLAAITISFPSAANSVLGQIRFIGSTQAISTLTLINAVFLNSIPSLNANDFFAFQQVMPNTWIFVQ